MFTRIPFLTRMNGDTPVEEFESDREENTPRLHSCEKSWIYGSNVGAEYLECGLLGEEVPPVWDFESPETPISLS